MNIQKNTELLKVEKKLNEALKAIQNLTTTVSELEAKNGILSQKVVDQDVKHNDEFRKLEKIHKEKTKSLKNKIDNLERLNRLLLAKQIESQDRAEKSRQELRILKKEISSVKENNKRLKNDISEISVKLEDCGSKLLTATKENKSLSG